MCDGGLLWLNFPSFFTLCRLHAKHEAADGSRSLVLFDAVTLRGYSFGSTALLWITSDKFNKRANGNMFYF